MLSSHGCKAFLSLKEGVSITFRNPLPAPRFYPLFQLYPLRFSLKFCTIASDPHSFVASYLINNCGFSPESAFRASKLVRFKTSQKPDSVLAFFRNHGFSDTKIYKIIRWEPRLLLCDPNKTILPKFEFLLSKGVSSSDIVRMATMSPKFLRRSLENHIIPTYELLNRFLQSDKKAVACISGYAYLLSNHLVALNVKLLLDNGVAGSVITRLFRVRASIFCSEGLKKPVEEVKDLGINPSKTAFASALLAKHSVGKSKWDAKFKALKRWGWPEGTILEAFKRWPDLMLVSTEKINAVMGYWVNQLGWDSLVLVRAPSVLGFSLEKRIVPRASVVQFLLSKGLLENNASLITPFTKDEKSFLERFVKCFGEESSHLLNLYEEKKNLNPADRRGNTGMLCLSKT